MKFVFPGFLYALAGLAIPIIVHLFSFRRFKKVYFSNVRFLKEIQQETQSHSKLKHLIVLISRMLAMTFLIFAFAQPYLPSGNKKLIMGDNAVSIFIDNSFSMDAVNKNGTLLDEAKKRALEIAGAYNYSDQFQLLTNDFQGRHQRLVSKEEFSEMLHEVKISPGVKTLKEITSRQFDLLNGDKYRNKNAYIISDFQKSVFGSGDVTNDTSVNVMLIPIVAQQRNNAYIDSCWFSEPVQQLDKVQQLNVRIKNKSDTKIENNPVKLYINGQQKAIAGFHVEANDQVTIQLSFVLRETGLQHGKIEISDYPVTFDDQFFFSFCIARQIAVLSINSSESTAFTNESPYLNSLFGKDSLFVFKNVPEDKLDYSVLSAYQLIVLNGLTSISSGLSQELKKFIGSGGTVLVFPGKKMEYSSYSNFFISLKSDYYENLDTADTKADRINYENIIFSDVFDEKNSRNKSAGIDLPVVHKHYKISKNIRSNGEYLLKLLNGDVLMSRFNFEKGKIYLSGVPLDAEFSNFPKHALFVPILYKIALYSKPIQKLFYTIGRDEVIETSNTNIKEDEVFHIKNVNGNFDIIPEHKVTESGTDLFIHGQITEAGNYNLLEKNEPLAALAFNYDRKESDLSCYTSDELNGQVESKGWSNFKIISTEAKSLTQTVIELNQGKKLWKLCVILALIFLGTEIALLRYLK